MVRLDAGVDEERAGAAPMLLLGEFAETTDVGRGVTAGESDPKEVAQRAGRKFAVVNEDE